MKKRKLPKIPTSKEFQQWLSNASTEEFNKLLSLTDNKKRLKENILAIPDDWKNFAKNYDYPFQDKVGKALDLISTYPSEKAIEELERLLTNPEAEQVLSFKRLFDESKEWEIIGMKDFPRSTQNSEIKEVLSSIEFWSKEKPYNHQLHKLRNLLIKDYSLANLILKGFDGMNNKLTLQIHDAIDELILTRRQHIKDSRKILAKLKKSEVKGKQKDKFIETLNETINENKNQLDELESRKIYETALEIVNKNPSRYIDLLVPMYTYIAEKWGYKKKNGKINRTDVAFHIKKQTGHRIKLKTIQTALDRYIL